MRGRWNGGYIGAQQTPTAGSVRGIFNAAEMQQLSGANLWPQPANDPYFQYVTALLQGNGGPPTSASGTNTTNFNADASTNNFLLALNGDVRNDEFHPYQEGYYSNFFDGTGDYLTISDNAAFEMTGDFTVEAWFYGTVWSAWSDVVTKGASGIYQPYYIAVNNGTLLFYSSSDGSSWNVANGVSLGAVNLNQWYHVAVSRQGTSMRLFLNGSLITTITNGSALFDNNLAVAIGGRSDGTELFTGYISNVRIVKGQGLYTAAFTPSTTPLTTTSQGATASNVSLLTCQSNRIIDNGRGASITRNGDVSVQYFQPFGQAALSAASFTNNQPSPGTNGYYGVYFDGSGDWLSASQNILNFGTSDFTIELWVYSGAYGSTTILLSNDGPTRTAGSITFFASSTNFGIQRITDGSGNAETLSVNTPPTANVWNHIAATKSGTTVRLFLNGTLLSTQTTAYSSWGSTTNSLQIGRRNITGFEGYLTGYISNLRILNGTALYTTNFTPSTTPLTAITNTSLLTCQSATLIDNSTNNFTITANGDAKVTVAQPFTSTVAGTTVVGYGSAYFDGTGDFLSATANNSFAYGSGDFTVEAWIYPTKYTASIIDNRTGGSATGLFLGLVAGGNVQVYSNVQVLLSPGTVPLNAWTHIALSRFSNTMYLYINGVAVTSGSNSTNYTDNNLRIGEQGGGGQPWGGYISNIRLVKGQAIYNGANFIPPNMPVTAVSNTQLLSLQYNGGAMNSGFEDTGPYDFLVTRAGNVAQGTFTPYGSNWSNYFDGTGDYLSINYASGSTIAGDFTWECWAYDTGATAYGTLLGWRNGSSGFSGFIIQRNNNNNVSVTINQSGFTITQTSNTYVTNQWNHVALVRSGSTVTLYVNGTSAGSGTLSGSFNPGSSYWIGSDPFNNVAAVQLQGYVSNQRFVNGTALYTANFTPSTAPLTAIANTSLLTCQSNRFIDNSTNNFTITRNGDTSVQRFSPFRPTVAYNSATYSGSAYFDGTGDYLTLPVNQSALALGSSDFTFEAWVYRTSGTGTAAIFAGQSDLSTAGGSAYVFYVSSTATTDLYVGGTGYGITSPNPVLGQWAHVAYARTGGTFSSYLNGVRVGTRSDLGTSSVNVGNQANPAAIGGFSNASNLLTGYITDARLIKGSGGYNATSSTLTIPAAPLASTTNTSLLLNMANAGQYDNAMMVNWESAGNTQSTPSQKKYGAASLYFDGTGDYLMAPSSPNIAFSGDFTIELWAYRAASGNYRAFTVGDTVGTSGIEIYVSGGNWVVYSNSATRITGTTATREVWTHLALVRSGSTVTMYVNGTASGSTWTSSATFSGTAYVGAEFFNGSVTSDTNGYIDDFRITRGVARYTSNFTPPTSQFVNT